MRGVCELCGRRGKVQRHHVSYMPQVIVYACNDCHHEVHVGRQNPGFGQIAIKHVNGYAYVYFRTHNPETGGKFETYIGPLTRSTWREARRLQAAYCRKKFRG